MDWLLAAATGRDANRDALLGQHLADFVPVLPLIPNRRSGRRQVLEYPISTSEVTALPLTQCGAQETTFAVADPMELAPLLRLDAVGWALRSVASIQHLSVVDPLHTLFLGEQGADAGNLLRMLWVLTLERHSGFR